MMEKRYSAAAVTQFVKSVFEKVGYNTAQAERAAQNLVIADLRGIDSHGVARLQGYIRLVEVGRIVPNVACSLVHETPSTAVLDANKGLGLIVGTEAMQVAIEKAKTCGTGWVSVKNSSHFGIAGQYVLQAIDNEMIGIAMTNASALVAPTGSKQRMLGTNPIAVGIPAGEEPPFVADLATTTAANGKLELLQRHQKDAPLGWLIDKEGNNSTDANGLKSGGALLPLGSDYVHGSHKGYALGSIVDIFSAVFSGANYGPWVPPFPAYVPIPENPVGEGIGHFFGAMRIDAWRPKDVFKAEIDRWIRAFRKATPINPEQAVLIPGDPERQHSIDRLANGIPIHPFVLQDLQELAARMGLAPLS